MPKPIIDLNDPEGNAFVLLGLAKKYAKQLNIEIDVLDMASRDYVYLVSEFKSHFGEYVDIVDSSEEEE